MTTNTYAGTRFNLDVADGPSDGTIWDAGKYANTPQGFCVSFKVYYFEASETTLYRREALVPVWVYGVEHEHENGKLTGRLVITAVTTGHIAAFPSWSNGQIVEIRFDPKRRTGKMTSK